MDKTARALALSPKSKKIVFAGDSITAGVPSIGKSYPMWFGVQTGHLHTVYNKGVAGNLSADLLVRFDIDVIANKPDCVVINIGKNDVSGSTTFATTISNIADMVCRCTMNGIIPILSTVIPYGNAASTFTQAQQDETIALNKWIRDFAYRSGLKCIDFWEQFLDTDGWARAEYLETDDIHPSKYGTVVMAGMVATLFESRNIKKVPMPSGTNLVQNWQFVDANANGVPDGFIAAGAGGATVTNSIISVDGYGKLFKMVHSAASTVGNPYSIFYQALTGWVVGDKLQFSIDAMMTDFATDKTTSTGISIRFRVTAGGAAESYTVHTFNVPWANLGRFISEFTVPTGATGLAIEIAVFVATQATIYIGRPSVVKV